MSQAEDDLNDYLDGGRFDDRDDEDGITCRRCGQHQLYWTHKRSGWRLSNAAGEIHSCTFGVTISSAISSRAPNSRMMPARTRVQSMPRSSTNNQRKERREMNQSNPRMLYALLMDGVITVKVKFSGTPHKLYTYKALADWNLQPGDLVMVDSPTNGIVAVEVDEVDSFLDVADGQHNGYKWLIQKVDLTSYNDRLAREQKFAVEVQKLNRRKQALQLLKDIESEYGSVDDLKKLMGVDAAQTSILEAQGNVVAEQNDDPA